MMWNSPRFFAVAAALVVGACGGGQARTQGTQNSPRSQASMRSLPDMLGPLGAHQSPAQLAEIAALIHRFERDPEAPFPENNTERSTLFWFMAWVVESPDVHVIASTVLGHLGEGRGADIGPMTSVASMLGMAATSRSIPVWMGTTQRFRPLASSRRCFGTRRRCGAVTSAMHSSMSSW